MDNVTLEQWSKIRAQGKGKYLFLHWILCAAIPVGFIVPFLRGIIIEESSFYFLSGRFFGSVLLFLLLCILIALIAGNRKWKKNERKLSDYLAIVREKDTSL